MITYLVIGIIWLVMINIATLIENRTIGISECEKACADEDTPLAEVPWKVFFLSCVLHIVIWPIVIPYYTYEVYFKKRK